MAIRLRDIKPYKRIVGLAKGEPGSWKTVGIASWAKAGPMYIFDLDHNLNSLVKMYWNHPEVLDNLFSDQFDGYYDSEKKLEEIHDETRDNLKRGISPACRYKSLLFDGLTILGRSLINKAIEARIETADDKELSKAVTSAEVYVAHMEDYRGESQGINNILSLLRSTVFEKADVNIFLTAHVVEVETRNQKNEITHVSRTVLTGGKKIAAEIPAYFTEIWHFDVAGSAGKPRYEIITTHGGDDFAKTAMFLPNKIEWTMNISDPSIPLLYDEVMRYAADPSLTVNQERKEGEERRTKFKTPVPVTSGK